ncbi:GGDEF domain-containing response regulator [Solidesulfovibrio magneticus]|uniref:diguanylate cyclase n=1 Tax=Solidesulfovibrio magneticus (strain ATCC 700980 / DSM 13731 / RS-1) TaxID=573370 RepID=C4XTI2_SOLM1|nr:diguanylate cyclase [Solidesulfovibrio magneticus]BAH75979.1 response regulator receiver protein [Solidesulfovibrio magneticus RS-1]
MNPRIVIADDSKLCMRILKDFSEALGYDLVGESNDGIGAIELSRKLRPDIVVLDVYMPGMNGYDACEIIQNELLIPVVLVTGASDEHTINKMLSINPAGVIIKPYSIFQFKTTIGLVYTKEVARVNLSRYKKIIANAPALFSLVDSSCRYVLVNEYYCKVFGKNEIDIVGHEVREFFEENVYCDFVKPNIDKALSGVEAKYEAWFDFPGIGRRYMSVVYTPYSEVKGNIQKGVVVFSSDSTELKMSEEKLDILSSTDQLTGVYNRRKFMESLHGELQRSARFDVSNALLSIDIDNFKAINDTYGHPVGDQALIYVAHILKNSLRQVDVLGRVGGEEFGVVAPGVGKEDVAPFLNRLIVEFNENLFDTQKEKIKITVSIGCVVFGRNNNIEEVLSKADSALYDSKHKGKNRFSIWRDPGLS